VFLVQVLNLNVNFEVSLDLGFEPRTACCIARGVSCFLADNRLVGAVVPGTLRVPLFGTTELFEFEAAFRDKFIPQEYIQQALDKYLAIKQTGTIGKYIVERETLKNRLGKLILQPLKESSFHN
jgi:hypothetical protein